MGAAVFFENLCWRMGTSAFVVLVNDAVKQATSGNSIRPGSALSAAGRFMLAVAGWFVAARLSRFHLFSVAAAVPGLILLLVCRHTSTYTNCHNFISLDAHPAGCHLCRCGHGRGRQPVRRVVTAVDDGRAGSWTSSSVAAGSRGFSCPSGVVLAVC